MTDPTLALRLDSAIAFHANELGDAAPAEGRPVAKVDAAWLDRLLVAYAHSRMIRHKIANLAREAGFAVDEREES